MTDSLDFSTFLRGVKRQKMYGHFSSKDGTMDVNEVINRAYQNLNADRVSLFIRNPSSNLLVCVFSEDILGVQISTEVGIAGASFRSGKLLNVPDIRTDPRHCPTVDNKIGYCTQNLLACPIFDNGGETIGVLQAINKKNNTSFNADDEETILEICKNLSSKVKSDSLLHIISDDTNDEEYSQITSFTLNDGKVLEASSSSSSTSSSICDPLHHINTSIYKSDKNSTVTTTTSATTTSTANDSFSILKTEVSIKAVPNSFIQSNEGSTIVDLHSKDLDTSLHTTTTTATTTAITTATTNNNKGHKTILSPIQLINFPKYDTLVTLPSNMYDRDFDVLSVKDTTVLPYIIFHYFKALFDHDDKDKNDNTTTTAITTNTTITTTKHLLNIDWQILMNLITLISSYYHQDNSFHNLYHATCVTHFTYILLTTLSSYDMFTPHILFAILLSAVVHDVDHPGNNNAYEVSSRSPLALLYNDKSVLENHHCSLAFQLMLSSPHTNILAASFTPKEQQEIREIITTCVLSTDMAHHFQLIEELESFRQVVLLSSSSATPADRKSTEGTGGDVKEVESNILLSSPSSSPSYELHHYVPGSIHTHTPIHAHTITNNTTNNNSSNNSNDSHVNSDKKRDGDIKMIPIEAYKNLSFAHVLLLSKTIVHSADLSNPVRPFYMTYQWAKNICHEFQVQLQREKVLGLPSSVINMTNSCDYAISKTESSFSSHVVGPLWYKLYSLFQMYLEPMIIQFEQNIQQWHEIICTHEQKQNKIK